MQALDSTSDPRQGLALGMPILRVLSAAEQVAEHLRAEVLTGAWTSEMPGVGNLKGELGVNHKTVEAALRILEGEGLLESQGARRPRLINPVPPSGMGRSMRVCLLTWDSYDRRVDYVVQIRHELIEAGHTPFFAPKSLTELDMDVQRLAKLVDRTEADAWIVMAGSREVLDFFATRKVPVFGLFGRLGDLKLAGTGPAKAQAYTEVVKALAARGHRRIVLLGRRARKFPVPGRPEQAFLDALEAEGIVVSDFNFPDWENSPEGFQRCLESLFRLTPPTALVVQELLLFVAVRGFLSKKGIRVPGDVSLVCADPDPSFAWCRPTVAHINMESSPWVRRVIRWASNVSRGKEDTRWVRTNADFVPGGTIGTARR